MTETQPAPVSYGEGHRTLGYVPLDALTPHPQNPKAHDLDTIDASVGRFGYVEPVVLDERTGYLISGHGRRETLLAMRERGETAPEGVKVLTDGTWTVPVARGWRSRTDSEATAALIALNKTTELGGWVDDELLGLLDDLREEDGGMVGVGFADDEVETLRARLAAEAVVDGFDPDAGSADSGDYGGGDVGEVQSFDLLGDVVEVIAVIPEDRREEFYEILHGLDWVRDARDKR